MQHKYLYVQNEFRYFKFLLFFFYLCIASSLVKFRSLIMEMHDVRKSLFVTILLIFIIVSEHDSSLICAFSHLSVCTCLRNSKMLFQHIFSSTEREVQLLFQYLHYVMIKLIHLHCYFELICISFSKAYRIRWVQHMISNNVYQSPLL